METESSLLPKLDDLELFEFIRKNLYSAVISDVLDEFGFRCQAMGPEVRPLSKKFVLVGRAKTILWVDVFEVGTDPYASEIAAVDSIKPGEVAVNCTNQSTRNAPWGELMSTATKARGGLGAIVDGLVRDSLGIIKMGFPVFCTGLRPIDSKGRGMVVDCDVPVRVGGVKIQPGDIVFGDNDGVVVVPSECERDVLEQALEKVSRERSSLKELRAGKLLRQVYDKYGVL
jgi:regulator of RNase E activity RraA